MNIEMTKLINCPFCRKRLDTRLIADFYFCKECEVAVRHEEDMPLSGADVYDENWVKSQQNDNYNFVRASYIVKQINKLSGISAILDVGCGAGILVDRLDRCGYAAEGIDSSLAAIEYARSCKKGGFQVSSINDFSTPLKYDLVVASQLIEHLRNPDVFLNKVKHLLRLGGYLYIETPNLLSWCKNSMWRTRIGGMYYGGDHRILYAPASLIRLVESHGFDHCRVTTKTYPPTILVQGVTTIRSFFNKKHRQYRHINEEISSTNSDRSFAKRTLRKIYARARESMILNAAFYVPNRLSEVNGRGNQLNLIAQHTTQQSNPR